MCCTAVGVGGNKGLEAWSAHINSEGIGDKSEKDWVTCIAIRYEEIENKMSDV